MVFFSDSYQWLKRVFISGSAVRNVLPTVSLLVFGKMPATSIEPDNDPLIGDPEVRQRPGRWLRNNYWRLRGVRTTGGNCVPFKVQSPRTPQDIIPSRSSKTQIWEITGEGLTLRFEKRGTKYALSDCQSAHWQK